MSARTAVRRPALAAAAAALVAAVAGTALMQPAAYAVPAENGKALKITLGAPVPNAPLTRGGAASTFELTVTNPSAKAASFHPWIHGLPAGPSRLRAQDVAFKVEAVDAPATDAAVGQQDGGWQGLFHPQGKKVGDGFEVPANGKLSWKVTVGLGKDYPTNNGDLTLEASSYAGELAAGGDASLTFTTDPAIKAGKFTTTFDPVTACEGSTGTDCRELNLKYRADGEGTFDTELATLLRIGGPKPADTDGLEVRARVDGTWRQLKGESGNFELPRTAKGFGAASGERSVLLQVKLGPKAKPAQRTEFDVAAEFGHAEGNQVPFASAVTKIQLAPAATASPSPSPSPTPKPSTSASASPSPSPSTTATATAVTTTTTTTGGTSGSLAATGADSRTGLFAALSAALIAAGGAAAWLGARRREATQS
ncbi:hypothetical protein C0216_28685 [Streptomyces globosus]|uniref:Gram-positive cocci surface proteins LPxTG domain-containing protein n=1 Tax=Streptomyces globosus TaxID=68209 RepID=A0A344U7K3_9ACTN|nr:hypothetical protein [Streptomyces globosus]AXE26874.1 hypothetical protein C0216_28685 [Streptomyces globosus]